MSRAGSVCRDDFRRILCSEEKLNAGLGLFGRAGPVNAITWTFLSPVGLG